MEFEEKIIIAFLFKRSGKNKLKESEIYLPLSLELGWFSAKEARQFVDHALEQKLLIKKDGGLTPSFSVEKINVPIGFSPSKTIFMKKDKGEKNNVMYAIVHRIGEKTNRYPEEIVDEVIQKASEKNILPEVAALLVAKDHNIDIEDILEHVENKILRENEE
ncbi:MAG: DUF2240 family protein [Thermoplasmatales archaeon]|nr:MAG: DUF2240 family protein [Thermoplasmatales archaeon]